MIVVSILLLCVLVAGFMYYNKKLKKVSSILQEERIKFVKLSEEHEMYVIRVEDLNNLRKEEQQKASLAQKGLQDQLDKAEAMLEEISNRYEKKIENLNENSKRLSNQILNSGSDIKSLRLQIEEKDRINNSLVEANNELMKKYADIKKVNASLVSSAGGYEKSNIQLRAALEEAAARYDENVNLFNSLKEEYDKVVAELDELTKVDKVDPDPEEKPEHSGEGSSDEGSGGNNEDQTIPVPEPEEEMPDAKDEYEVKEDEVVEDDQNIDKGSSDNQIVLFSSPTASKKKKKRKK